MMLKRAATQPNPAMVFVLCEVIEMNYLTTDSLSKYDRSLFAALFDIAAGMNNDCGRPRTRVVAALAYKNTIVIGQNSLKSDTFQAKYSANKDSIFLHAETAAIKNGLKVFNGDLSRCKLFVLRAKYRSGTKTDLQCGLALPCNGCMKAIIEFKVGKVLFTTDTDKIGVIHNVN